MKQNSHERITCIFCTLMVLKSQFLFILLMLLYPLVTVYIVTEGYASANGLTLFLSNILSKAMLSMRTYENNRLLNCANSYRS